MITKCERRVCSCDNKTKASVNQVQDFEVKMNRIVSEKKTLETTIQNKPTR